MRTDFRDREELQRYLQEEFPDSAAEGGALSPTPGGRKAAMARLEAFPAGKYAATRNFVGGSVSGLSPWIRHGVLSLTEVREAVIQRSGGSQRLGKFIQELAWRDYWQRLYKQLREAVWQDQEEYKTGVLASQYAEELPQTLLTARTDLQCMDSFVRDLQETGYMHNHARMWFAAYVVHWLRVRWQAGARLFLSHLLDGDPASNNLSWQWVASTFSSKPYFFNRENLENYTNGVYCSRCPSRDCCPFDAPYEVLAERLFPRDADAR
ncbi:MAG: deoxyribodipyrimidine photo-lyase [Bryobacteraceae bacterium]|nr:deoxyribodipyrimidine photo-lyase [Bryobacteraceae bacterium]